MAGFAAATRNVGLFLVIPLAFEWLRGGAGREYVWWRAAACLALAPSGLFWYAVYLWLRSGNLFLFYSVQGYWSRRPTDPLTFATGVFTEAYEGLTGLFRAQPLANTALEDMMGRLNGTTDAYNLLFLLFAVALLLLGLRVLPFSLSAYAFLLVVPAMFFGKPETPLMGFQRYVLVAFPLFIVLAVLFKERRLLVSCPVRRVRELAVRGLRGPVVCSGRLSPNVIPRGSAQPGCSRMKRCRIMPRDQ